MLKPIVNSVMTRNKILMSLVILLITIFAYAQAPEWRWATQAGGTASDYARSITLDDAENSYITGYFSGTAIFDSTYLTSSGEEDIFVAKLDTNGNWQWATQAGGLFYDNSYSITLDDAGNSYITGSFWDTATFGSHTLTNSYNRDIFVAKLDAGGNWQWAIQAGGSGSDKAWTLSSDESGNSYILGRFQDTATFGSISLTSNGPDDIFVAKLDTNGNWQWATQAGGNSGAFPQSISLDEAGNSYITGTFEVAANFGSTSLTSNYKDTFVAKLSANGNWQWATQVVGDGFDSGYSITLDEADNSYITGVFHDTATFGSTSLTSIGWSDIYVAKLDSYGNWQWATQAGGDVGSHANEIGFSIKLDEAGNSYITGQFSETAAFGSTYLTSSGQSEIFVAKLDTNGNWQWATQAGGIASDYARSIVLGEAGNYYIAGFISGTATFGSLSLTSGGGHDIFVAKLDYTIIADFTADQTSVLLDNEIQFTDLSTNNPNSWAWDFENDGIIDSFEQNPNYTYLEIGNYSVSLTVSNEFTSDTEFKTDYINVLGNSTPFIVNPISDFAFDEDTVNNSIDLNSVFDDPDVIYGDELTFSFSGNVNIAVEIVSGIVTLTPSQDWNGIETITFTATDNFLEQISDDVVVTIIPVNDAPEITLPDDLTFEEDTNLINDFTAYITDIEQGYDELILSVTGNTEITVDIIGMIVSIGSTENWNGTETLTFTVDDNQNRSTVSDSVTIIVIPVNDSPILNITSTFEADEDLPSQTYNFSSYCTQTFGENDILTLSADNSDHINVTILDFNVIFESNTLNWNGTEDITFFLDDNISESISKIKHSSNKKRKNEITRDVVSQIIQVTINPVNDAPTIVLPDFFTFPEDGSYVEDFTVYINDVEYDELTISVSGNSEIIVNIVNTLVLFDVTDDWNGTETLTFTVDDNVTRATAEDDVDVIVISINDEPVLIGYQPEELAFTVFQDSIVTFSVEVEDIDSIIEYEWFFDGVLQVEFTNEFIYTFEEVGDFEIKSVASDEEYEIETVWIVEVEPEVRIDELLPISTKLHNNFPNPFNPITTIMFDIKEHETGILTIFNIKGQLIESQEFGSGQKIFSWDAANQSSGVYLYKLETESVMQIRKMLLLK